MFAYFTLNHVFSLSKWGTLLYSIRVIYWQETSREASQRELSRPLGHQDRSRQIPCSSVSTGCFLFVRYRIDKNQTQCDWKKILYSDGQWEIYISFQVKHLKVVLDFISNLVGIENVKRLMCISSSALNIDYTNSQVNDFLFLFFYVYSLTNKETCFHFRIFTSVWYPFAYLIYFIKKFLVYQQTLLYLECCYCSKFGKYLDSIRSLGSTVPTFSSCSKCVGSASTTYDRTPDCHPVSWLGMVHGWPHIW